MPNPSSACAYGYSSLERFNLRFLRVSTDRELGLADDGVVDAGFDFMGSAGVERLALNSSNGCLRMEEDVAFPAGP